MKQNNSNLLAGVFFIVGIVIFILLQSPNTWPHYSDDCLDYEKINRFEHVHYTGISWDVIYTYGPIIAGKKCVTDWHSALYMYECKVLQKIATVFSKPADGIYAQIILYYIYFIVTLLSACYFIYQIIKSNIISSLLFIPVCISISAAICWMKLVLDYFFCCHLIVLCILVWHLLRNTNNKGLKIIEWVLIGVCIFHMVNFRKNSVCIIPIVCYIFFACHGILANRFKTRVIASLLFAVTIAGVCIALPPLLAPVKHTHPITPMLSSDVRIAAVLRGEQVEFRKKMKARGKTDRVLNHSLKNALSAAPSEELSLPKGYSYYTSEWKKNFDSMLTSKMIQMVEFYCGGTMPHPFFCKIVEHFYPQIKANPEAWKYWNQIPRDIMYYQIVILIAGSGFVAYFAYLRIKNIRTLSYLEKTAAAACSMAIFYAVSFAFVTPTAFPRYLTPSLFIIWNAIWFWMADALFRHMQLNCNNNS